MAGPEAGAMSRAMCDGFNLLVVGVDGPRAGATAKAVCFLPIVRVGWKPSNGPSKTTLRPIERAADRK